MTYSVAHMRRMEAELAEARAQIADKDTYVRNLSSLLLESQAKIAAKDVALERIARESLESAVASSKQIATARRDALEEAARVADGWMVSNYDESANVMSQNIANDIRALAAPAQEKTDG